MDTSYGYVFTSKTKSLIIIIIYNSLIIIICVAAGVCFFVSKMTQMLRTDFNEVLMLMGPKKQMIIFGEVLDSGGTLTEIDNVAIYSSVYAHRWGSDLCFYPLINVR